MAVLAKVVSLFFRKVYWRLFFFFFWHALIDRCQIVTDTCENNVSKFVGGLLNQLYHLADISVSVKPLS